MTVTASVGGGVTPRGSNEVADSAMSDALTRAHWRKSAASNYAGNCVEIARLPGGQVGIRDSKARDGGPVLVVGREHFASLLAQLKNGNLSF